MAICCPKTGLLSRIMWRTKARCGQLMSPMGAQSLLLMRSTVLSGKSVSHIAVLRLKPTFLKGSYRC